MFNPMSFAQKVSLRGTQVLARYFGYWGSMAYFLVHNYSYIINQREEAANGKRVNVRSKHQNCHIFPRRSKTSE